MVSLGVWRVLIRSMKSDSWQACRVRSLIVCMLFLLGTSCGNASDNPADAGDGSSVDLLPDVSVDAESDVGRDADALDLVPDDLSDSVPSDLGEDSAEPVVCDPWASPWSAEPLFVDRSAQWQLDEGALNVLGNRLTSADLDGDGYADLVVHQVGSNDRDDPSAGNMKRRVLMNRPATTGKGRVFVDATVESKYGIIPGSDLLGRAAHFVVFGDVDNDGDLDAFSGTYSDRNNTTKIPDRSIVLLNDGSGHFSPAPASDISPAEEWSTTSASFVDYDRDGNLDVWVGNFYAIWGYETGLQDRLYKGHGDGTFEDVTLAAGLQTTNSGYDNFTNHRPTYGVSTCDIDSDGDMDLLQSSYGRQLNMLWLNSSSYFTNVADTVNYDADDNMNFIDNQFYCCYCYSGATCDPKPDPCMISCDGQYWGSNDAKPYRNGGNTFSTLCADLDNDGDMDAYNAEIVHWHIGQSSDPSQILRNDPADNELGWEFVRPGREATGLVREHTSVDWNEGDIYIVAFDVDNDGLIDIYQPSSDYPGTHGWLFRGKGGGVFENADSASVASGLDLDRVGGLSVADFDLDGDQDVVVAYSTMRCDAECEFSKPVVRLFENTLDGRGNWIEFVLRGKGAATTNASATGARVEVYTADGLQVREVSGGYGHFGIQNTTDVHFGLRDTCVIDHVVVAWPNKELSKSHFWKVKANMRYEVREDTGELLPLTTQQGREEVQ